MVILGPAPVFQSIPVLNRKKDFSAGFEQLPDTPEKRSRISIFRKRPWMFQTADQGDEVISAGKIHLPEIARTYDITFTHEAGNPKPVGVSIGGADVTSAIRTAEIDRAVSPVSAVPAVREALVAQQQRIGRSGDYVVEGRDIGTVVFPEAPLKVFLTASNEARARRRVLQNEQRGVGSTDFETVLADIIRRDEYDSSRAASPLKPADDAVHVDSSDMTMEEVIDKICELARERM